MGARLGCRDPDEDKVLEVALMGAADCIVIGDQNLLEITPFRGLPILTPANFPESLPDTVQSSWLFPCVIDVLGM